MPAHKVGEPRPAVTVCGADIDEKIGGFIARYKGEANAVRIDVIAHYLWTDEYLHGGDKTKRNMARTVKDSVRRMRRAGKKIGSSRGSKFKGTAGYYMIETAAELDSTVGPLRRQALDQLATCAKLTGRDFYYRELAGQGRLIPELPEGPADQSVAR